jgi:hypothetical protein
MKNTLPRTPRFARTRNGSGMRIEFISFITVRSGISAYRKRNEDHQWSDLLWSHVDTMGFDKYVELKLYLGKYQSRARENQRSMDAAMPMMKIHKSWHLFVYCCLPVAKNVWCNIIQYLERQGSLELHVRTGCQRRQCLPL